MESEAAQPQKCSCKCHKHAVAFFAVLLIAGVACWYIHHPNRPRAYPNIDPKPGTVCTVMLRESQTSFEGTVVAANREAILLEGRTTRSSERFSFWIPKHSILYIRIAGHTSPWEPKKRNADDGSPWQQNQTETGE